MHIKESANMSLVAMVYYVLLAQCALLTLLCLPYIRNIVTYFGKFIPGKQFNMHPERTA